MTATNNTNNTRLQELLRGAHIATVAKELGMDRSSIYRYRDGSRLPGRRSALRLVRYFSAEGLTVEGCWGRDCSSHD